MGIATLNPHITYSLINMLLGIVLLVFGFPMAAYLGMGVLFMVAEMKKPEGKRPTVMSFLIVLVGALAGAIMILGGVIVVFVEFFRFWRGVL